MRFDEDSDFQFRRFICLLKPKSRTQLGVELRQYREPRFWILTGPAQSRSPLAWGKSYLIPWRSQLARGFLDVRSLHPHCQWSNLRCLKNEFTRVEPNTSFERKLLLGNWTPFLGNTWAFQGETKRKKGFACEPLHFDNPGAHVNLQGSELDPW